MTEQAKTPSGANAPYKHMKEGGRWVVKNNIGEVKATFPGDDAGEQKSLAYMRALYASVPGAGKRAAKTPFTGKAKNRIKADELRERIAQPYAKAAGLPNHNFLPGVDNLCLSCGLPLPVPMHMVDATTVPGQIMPGPQVPPKQKAEYTGSGCMVALYPSSEDLDKISISGGPDFPVEPRSEMHITMAYLPETPEGEELQKLRDLVKDVARTQGPLRGTWGGTARFNPSEGSDSKPVLVALPDLPDLSAFRQFLVEALDAAGFEVSMSHGYTPHLTVAYDDQGQVRAVGDIEIDTIALSTKDDRWSFTLTGEIDTEMAGVALREQAKRQPNAAADAETERIKESAKTEKAKGVHPFQAAEWTHPNGHPRCKVCGQEESISPECNREPTAAERTAFQEKLDAEFAATIERARVFVQERLIPGRVAGAEVAHDDHYLEDLQDKLVTGVDAAVDQVMTLLRSTPDLPPYAAQAQSLLELVDEAVDFLMLIRALPDADDDAAQAEDLATQDKLAGEAASTVTASARVLARPTGPESLEVTSELPATRAFLTEVNGRTLLTAPASTFVPAWEKALTPNQHFLWVQGNFVGAEKANRNGAFWSTKDLEMGQPTVQHGPLNWLHEAKHVIGTIADSKLVLPHEGAAQGVVEPHIVAAAAIWKWIYPDEAFVVEQASDQSKLWYSMECVSREVACTGDGGCGKSFPYMDVMKASDTVCEHVRQKASTRRFVDPTFLGAAVIVPPVRPGWAEADARVMREAAALAETAFEDAGRPDVAASEWESLMAQVVAYASR